MKWWAKLLVVALALLAVVEAGLLLQASIVIDTKDDAIRLMEENADLMSEISRLQDERMAQTVRLCRYQVRFGEAYRVVLERLVDDLGLDSRPESAAAMLLGEIGHGVGGQ